MTDGLKRFALPGDIVSLDGRRGTGKVLDWNAQLAIDRREMEQSHFPIGSVESPIDARADRFWPQNQVTIITRHTVSPPPTDPFDDPIRF